MTRKKTDKAPEPKPTPNERGPVASDDVTPVPHEDSPTLAAEPCKVCGRSREMMADREPCPTCGTQLEDSE